MDIFHWVSLVAKGQTMDLQMFVFALFGVCRCILDGAGNTYNTAYRIIQWSFFWLYQGKWPTHDWDRRKLTGPQAGKDLADGFFCVIWNYKGLLFFFCHTRPPSSSPSPSGFPITEETWITWRSVSGFGIMHPISPAFSAQRIARTGKGSGRISGRACPGAFSLGICGGIICLEMFWSLQSSVFFFEMYGAQYVLACMQSSVFWSPHNIPWFNL